MSFQLTVTPEGKMTKCMLVGEIDERAQLKTDFNLTPVFILELGGLKMINSVGVGKWVKWMSALQLLKKDIAVIFRRVPYVVVRAMNSIDGFLPARYDVESFIVPYYCAECDTNHDFQMVKGKDFKAGAEFQFREAKLSCPKCQSPMELDVVPERYFQFLKQIK